MTTGARRTEIDFFKGRGVYTKRLRNEWMKVHEMDRSEKDG